MIWAEILNSRIKPALRAAPAAARVTGAAMVAAAGGVAVLVAAAAVPALAAQHPGGPAASHARAGAPGQHTATGRMSPGRPWADISAGDFYSCGIRTDGTLWCWGDNGLGELGIGNETNQDLPRQVTTPAAGGWASVTAGGSDTCATRTDATLWCWGDNESGQLGTGDHSYTGQDRPRQITTPAPGGWASVTSHGVHTCATRTGGTLWCWGDNSNGELGIGSHTNQDRPRQVTTPAAGGWASVTAGELHTCATRTGGTLWCWGWNLSGQLGIGNETDQDLPQQVTTPAPGGWASVTGDYDHTCATRTGATLWCWGDNTNGELGIGNQIHQDLPQQVTTPAPGGWASVTAGDFGNTCATRTGATLWCWGNNSNGELGIGDQTDQDLPRQVTTPAAGGWASASAGFADACAIRTGGSLWCWGSNYSGELGLGNHTDQDRPRQVTGCAQPGTHSQPVPASPSGARPRGTQGASGRLRK